MKDLELERLAEQVSKLEFELGLYGMMQAPEDYEDKIKVDVRYKITKDKLIAASNAYYNYLNSIPVDKLLQD